MVANTQRQWMVTHEWMLKGNRQTEWIEKRGILLWLAFYMGGLGGGLYVVSLFFNNFWGMLAGWLIVTVLKGGFHFAFLGQPTRFWRMVMHPQTSWLSRGLLFVLSFTATGFIQMVLFRFMEGTPLEIVARVAAGGCALAVATYTGFVLNEAKGVTLWSLPLLPIIFLSSGILGGFGLTTAMAMFDENVSLAVAEAGSRWMLLFEALLVFAYLALAARKDETGRKSVLYQLKGSMAVVFWGGVVLMGAAVPAIVAIYGHFASRDIAAVVIAAVACEVVGAMLLRYCLLKSAIYVPLIERHAAQSTKG